MINQFKQETLNKLLGDELIAHLQYLIASKIVIGTDYDTCKTEFKEHSDEELEHFNTLLDLMVERGYSVNSDLKSLITESYSGYEFMIGTMSKKLTEFQHSSELNAIKAYREFLNYLEKEPKKDYSMIQEIKHILKEEIEHRTDLEKLYTSITEGGKLESNESNNFSDWVKDAKVEHGVLPEGTFTGDAKSIVSKLLKNSDDREQALKRLNFYINRAGDKLSNKEEIMKAKDMLMK